MNESESGLPKTRSGSDATVLHPSPKGSRPYRNPLRARLRKVARHAPQGPHPSMQDLGVPGGSGTGERTSLRRAIREARNQLRDAEREAHLAARRGTLTGTCHSDGQK